MAFQPGDVVFLKSGGQPLTVIAIDEDNVECIWIGDDGAFYRETIPAVALAEYDISDDEEEDEEESSARKTA